MITSLDEEIDRIRKFEDDYQNHRNDLFGFRLDPLRREVIEHYVRVEKSSIPILLEKIDRLEQHLETRDAEVEQKDAEIKRLKTFIGEVLYNLQVTVTALEGEVS